MYLSRVEPKNTHVAQLMIKNAYQMHKGLWRLFTDGPDKRRDFLFRSEPYRWGQYLVVSAVQPKDAYNDWTIETKLYDPKLTAGDRMYFALRANPVRTIKDQYGKSKRVDVVMDAKHSLKQQGIPFESRPSKAELAYVSGRQWLLARVEAMGVSLLEETLRVEGYNIHRFIKNGKGGRQRQWGIQFASLDFEGCCVITDPQRLRTALFEGVGPAKAFGCGLMLVKRV